MRRKKRNTNKSIVKLLFSLIILTLLSVGAYFKDNITQYDNIQLNEEYATMSGNYYSYDSIQSIPKYDGEPYVTLNNNIPYFTEEEYITNEFEKYSELDDLRKVWSCLC